MPLVISTRPVTRRAIPAVLTTALVLFAFLRALLVRPCDFSGLGLHDYPCYLLLPPSTLALSVAATAIQVLVVGAVVHVAASRCVPSRVVGRLPRWLSEPSNGTVAVVGLLFAGLALMTVVDPRGTVWWIDSIADGTGTLRTLAVYALYLPTAGALFGGNYFVAVLRGMVGVTSLPVRLLVFGLTVGSSLLQVVWSYALAAGVVAIGRKARGRVGEGADASS